MQKKRMGLGDIARKLNISISTVSFILNGKAEEMRISSELSKRVIQLAQEMNYVPNQLAKSLRTGKTNIIALIVENISNPFFANVARLIEERADAKGYKIIYCSSDNDPSKTRELIKVFRERQVDGYIITPSEGLGKDIAALLADHFPVVLFDRRLPGQATNYVGVDNELGTFQATEHLVRQGYKNIAFVTLNTGQTQMQERLNGYVRAMTSHGMKQYVKKVLFHDHHEKMIEQIVALLTRKKDIDAIFFATNYLGVSGLEAVKRLGLQIPNDIAVMSFDDHDLFRLYSPAITAVAQPVEEMSERVIQLLLDQLEGAGQKETIHDIVLPPTLVVRESTPVKATRRQIA